MLLRVRRENLEQRILRGDRGGAKMTLGAIPEVKVPREDELERGEKFASGRVVGVAVDHGPNSRITFTWALDQIVTHADTIHLVQVRVVTILTTGETAKEICAEAERSHAVAIIMGCRGLGPVSR